VDLNLEIFLLDFAFNIRGPEREHPLFFIAELCYSLTKGTSSNGHSLSLLTLLQTYSISLKLYDLLLCRALATDWLWACYELRISRARTHTNALSCWIAANLNRRGSIHNPITLSWLHVKKTNTSHMC